MSDDIEQAQQAMEHAHHASQHGDGPGFARTVAVLVAALAAGLALAEMGEKSAQNEYLTYHITATDDWAFFQAKNIRSNIYALQADLLDSLPNAADPALRQRAQAARVEAKRLDDDEKSAGRKQLAAKARESTRLRDEAFHRYHLFEAVVGALQITIVLASVAVVTRVRTLAAVAAALGLAAGAAGVAVGLALV